MGRRDDAQVAFPPFAEKPKFTPPSGTSVVQGLRGTGEELGFGGEDVGLDVRRAKRLIINTRRRGWSRVSGEGNWGRVERKILRPRFHRASRIVIGFLVENR